MGLWKFEQSPVSHWMTTGGIASAPNATSRRRSFAWMSCPLPPRRPPLTGTFTCSSIASYSSVRGGNGGGRIRSILLSFAVFTKITKLMKVALGLMHSTLMLSPSAKVFLTWHHLMEVCCLGKVFYLITIGCQFGTIGIFNNMNSEDSWRLLGKYIGIKFRLWKGGVLLLPGRKNRCSDRNYQ